MIQAGFQPVTKAGYGAHFPAAIPASDSAKDLIAKLLTKDTAKRLTAAEALGKAIYFKLQLRGFTFVLNPSFGLNALSILQILSVASVL